MFDFVNWIADEWWRIAVAGTVAAAGYGYLVADSIRTARENREEIACAAIKYPDIGVLALPAPARHHHIMWARLFVDGKATKGEATQGFLTTHRRFVNRVEGLKIAEKRGQIVKKHPMFTELYSEDMWDTPDESRGYVIHHVSYDLPVDA